MDMVLRREKGWLGWLSNAPQRWAAFDGALGRWSIGETDAAMRSAVRKEIAARKRLPIDAKTAKEMSKAAWLSAVHAMLKHHSMLEIPRHQFNADPDLLGTPAGALRFGVQVQVEAGRPDHMLSKATRFALGWRGTGGRIEWDRFMLEFCSGDKSLVAWLQAFCGYCLTGHTTEHIMLFLYGPGGNGKSLFLDTLGAVMSDYHVRADHRLFMAKQGNFHLAPLATLEGARLVTCPDVPHNATWDMGLVKPVTGGGSITANYMRENPFSFFPECKLMLAGNDKPRLESVDEGVRRRLRLVPCLFVPASVDRSLGKHHVPVP
jgi:putative DNA primase/helicase